jgi:hypothetical protein
VQTSVRALQPLIKECYELALRTQPDLQGRLVVRFEIVAEAGLGGVVEQAQIVRDGDAGVAASPALDECLKATIESLTFPPPKGRGTIVVTYPFVFAAK